MVLNLKPLGNLRDPRTPLWRHTFQGEQELMLPGLQSGSTSVLLTEMQKPADLVPQFGQRFVLS
jgi:hypothetical protein